MTRDRYALAPPQSPRSVATRLTGPPSSGEPAGAHFVPVPVADSLPHVVHEILVIVLPHNELMDKVSGLSEP